MKNIKAIKYFSIIFILINISTHNALANENPEHTEDEKNKRDVIVITTPNALELRVHRSKGFGEPPPFIANVALSLFFAQKSQKLRMFAGGSLFMAQETPEGYYYQKESFDGIEATAGLVIGDRYAAYASINAFLALSRWCNKNKKRPCQGNEQGGAATMGIAPEVGLRISIYDRYYISVFRRRQISIGALENYDSSGIGIGYR